MSGRAALGAAAGVEQLCEEKMETRTSPSTGQPPSEKVIVDAPWLGTASGSDLGEDEGHGGREGGVGGGRGWRVGWVRRASRTSW